MRQLKGKDEVVKGCCCWPSPTLKLHPRSFVALCRFATVAPSANGPTPLASLHLHALIPYALLLLCEALTSTHSTEMNAGLQPWHPAPAPVDLCPACAASAPTATLSCACPTPTKGE